MTKTALIVGAGSGISAAFARALCRDGYAVALAARDADKLAGLVKEVHGLAIPCDVSSADDVERLFSAVDDAFGRLDVVLFNPSFRTRGPIEDLPVGDVERALMVGAYGGFLVGRAATQRMLKQGHEGGRGTILFTGASASVKGYPQSAPFAMAKFALRGLAQSMARELAPKGIHVAHIVVDGGVRNAERGRIEAPDDKPDSLLDPEAIAETYLHLVRQPRSAWTWEIELRPWVERF